MLLIIDFYWCFYFVKIIIILFFVGGGIVKVIFSFVLCLEKGEEMRRIYSKEIVEMWERDFMFNGNESLVLELFGRILKGLNKNKDGYVVVLVLVIEMVLEGVVDGVMRCILLIGMGGGFE